MCNVAVIGVPATAILAGPREDKTAPVAAPTEPKEGEYAGSSVH
jgi:hypothetical protein